ncbi:MAG: LTA synthase family protein [Oscillospiraceae bacterium]|nr:LTA synthase family protein [Oscillospiraceae bacterium]
MRKENLNPVPGKRKAVCFLIGEILLMLLLAIAAIVFFSALWLSDVFPDLQPDELFFHMKTSLSGTGSEMISEYILKYGIPEILVTGAICFLMIRSRSAVLPLHRWHRIITAGTAVLCVAGIGGAMLHMERSFELISYIRSQSQTDTFIEDNYVDPAAAELRFPSKKRNLIYIYLESMELAFADEKSGGAFEENYIPELTELALKNTCFNGGSDRLNGAVTLQGTTWTMGSVFGQNTGLPLMVGINGNDMETQASFFPSVTALGDILENAGYVNVSLQGTDASFAGEKVFFADHGDFEVFDYCYARDHNWIPLQYKVWWGYEDEKLFSFAKAQLTELAGREDTPFNLTLQTMDTHKEDGYVCDLCGDEFGENRYANVLACSSRQVSEFVRWVQAQDFYENTTIVIAGDHPTMDSDFCSDLLPDYQRKVYVSIINGAPVQGGSDKARDYSTLDLFPTTLAALGVQIPGDRLGLGTNLYSDTQTLVERYGQSECNSHLRSRSELMESLNHITLTDKLLTVISKATSITTSEDEEGTVFIYPRTAYNCGQIDDVRRVEVEYWDLSRPSAKHRHAAMNWSAEKNAYYTELSVYDIDYANLAAAVRIVKTDKSTVQLYGVQCSDNIHRYLSRVGEGDYLVFIAACNDASKSLYNNTAALLHQLGANLDLQGHSHASYILIADTSAAGNEPIYEELSKDSIQIAGEADGVSYDVRSVGADSGCAASIKINGVEWAVNSQGLNIVVFDRTQGRVIDSVCFNTNAPAQPAIRNYESISQIGPWPVF